MEVKRRVADIIMDILVDNGITDCFAVVGGGAMHLDNALALNNKITKYFNHHEQAMSHGRGYLFENEEVDNE